jgi:D-sedoheptulose 7-phosphate isomerase
MKRQLALLIDKLPELAACRTDVELAFALLHDCFQAGGKLLLCGNGGSAADCEHLVGELMKGYLSARPLPAATRQQLLDAFPKNGRYLADHLQGALPAVSLASQVGLITAYANDVAPDMIFAQQVYGYGRAGDVIMGISTSGNSRNVLHALQVGRALGLRTLGFTGGSGGAMKELCDVFVCAPAGRTADIQEHHLAIYHTLCALLEEAFFQLSDAS